MTNATAHAPAETGARDNSCDRQTQDGAQQTDARENNDATQEDCAVWV